MTQAEADVITRQFKKALQGGCSAGADHHLGYPPGGTKPVDTTNQRNGHEREDARPMSSGASRSHRRA